MSNDDVIKTLSSIKGIGTWTAEMFLIFTMGRIDVLKQRYRFVECYKKYIQF